MKLLPTLFQKNKPVNLTGEEILDSLIVIAEKFENSFPEHITRLKSNDSYFSKIIRSYVPWATYQHNLDSNYLHNPYYGSNCGKEILKKN